MATMRIQALNPYTKNKYYLKIKSKADLTDLLNIIARAENQFFIFEKFEEWEPKALVYIHGSELKKFVFSIV